MKVRMIGGPEHWKTYAVRDGSVEAEVNGTVYVFDPHRYEGKGVPEGYVIFWEDKEVK